jgi:hypothetical protein
LIKDGIGGYLIKPKDADGDVLLRIT